MIEFFFITLNRETCRFICKILATIIEWQIDEDFIKKLQKWGAEAKTNMEEKYHSAVQAGDMAVENSENNIENFNINRTMLVDL